MVAACSRALFVVFDFAWYFSWNSWNVGTMVLVGYWIWGRVVTLNVASFGRNLFVFDL